ncbi:Methyltransferase type 11 [Cordyceps fumosorosea ARSEF 2679]|uniref:Methyltransferase type 11 n=1 Tax=Cordyceps fumosorosea (strain ARSEF 2679) TaxID=1081104 RepID=A0A162MUB8_CORFA|nr:Methyltransferase type 11 [Cordyceps fumosorosea ARSEF 2679]OAA70579.1 Methyltransferase type 11 [Cordyceps fumosorosea ARSEF 2679]
MSQNIYDRPDFFAAYSETIDRSGHKDLDKDLLWKRLRTLLPPSLAGLRVLDVGCGSGWFARWAVTHGGAASVTALDISTNMITKARALNRDLDPALAAKIDYRIADLDGSAHDLGEGYDLAFSSLVLHYIAALRPLVEAVHGALRPGALFVVNLEHPVYTAPRRPRVVEDAEGERSWNLGAYHEEGERVVDWLAPGLRKQHRTLQGYLDIFMGAGFELARLVELLPTEEELAAGEFDEEELLRPLFLMMGLKKRLE